jgi:lipoyl(octanoyl) transferase
MNSRTCQFSNEQTNKRTNDQTEERPNEPKHQNTKTPKHQLVVRHLGRQPYEPVWQAMRDFTDRRDQDTVDELWFVEHDPVFTQGLAGKPEHLLNPGNIPVVQTDRGGQITYHGPGQLLAYPLLDLKRRGLGVRCLVNRLEQAVIDVLAERDVRAERLDGAPGVFVAGAKIASIGLKVRRECTFHGLAFNVDMDLTPFSMINPCGFAGLAMTQLREYQATATLPEVAGALTTALCTLLGYHAMKAQDCGLPEPLPIRAA